jgi:hypothetical protein
MFKDIPFPRSQSECEEAAKRDPAVVLHQCIENARTQKWRDAENATWTFVPPIIVLMAGFSIGWIMRGFKPKQ